MTFKVSILTDIIETDKSLSRAIITPENDSSVNNSRSRSVERSSLIKENNNNFSSSNVNQSSSSKLYSRSRSVETSRRAMSDLPNSGNNNQQSLKKISARSRSSATTEYRAAYSNWPTEKLDAIDALPAAGCSTGTMSINCAAKKSMSISDFNEVRAAPVKASHVLFQKETTPVTEYKKSYKPFSRYVYVAGLGWKKSKNVQEKEGDKVVDWYGEVAERTQKANEFRSRSEFGHPVVSVEHLEEIYRETNPNSFAKDRSIAALALATTQLRIQESRAAREGNKSLTPQQHHPQQHYQQQRSSHVNAILSPQKDHISRKQLGEWSWSCPIHNPIR